MFPKDSSDFEPLASAAFNVWAPGAKVRYNSLRPGFSGAAVLRVDVRNSRVSQVEEGQYVLKLSRSSTWHTFESELEAQDRAYKFNDTFAKFHIPPLVRSLNLSDQNGYALLYEIAGASLAAFISMDGPEKPEFKEICQQVISDLLTYWTESEPAGDQSPRQLLESWLGYRLQSDKAPTLHAFVKKMAGTKLLWNDAGEVLINPLTFYKMAKESDLPEISVINACLHYDLHGGNLLVHQHPLEKPYQIVDLGQSQIGPVGFDQAYLEMAEIIYCMGENDPTQLINLLKCLDDPSRPTLLPPHTSWLYDCLKKMRAAFDEWRDRSHPRRIDDLNRQMRLAQVAAGLNWANKPLSEGQRYLGLCYAGWAAREYLRLYDQATWDGLWPGRKGATGPAGHHEATEADYALWEELWKQMQGFASTTGRFVLVTEAQRENENAPYLGAIGQIPWSAVIDLDPASDIKGLYRQAGPVLQSHRGVHTFDKRLPTVNYQYGTAWMMAAGWELKGVPHSDYENWRFDKLHLIRAFANEIETKTSPDPIYVVAMPGGGLDQNRPLGRLSVVLQELYDGTRGRARIFLLGSGKANVEFNYSHLPLDPELFMQFVAKTFGSRPIGGVTTIPGTEGTDLVSRELSIEDLRTMQENMEVLHSNILNEVNGRAPRNGATFWRGAPPSWSELQQGVDIPRTVHKDLIEKLRSTLEEKRNRTVVLFHHPGAGATTEAYRAAWDLHREYPTCILTRWSEALSSRLQKLYRLAQRPILLVAEAPTMTETQREELHRDLSQNNTPVVMLYLRRGFQHEEETTLKLEDPMPPGEAKIFYERYKALTDDPLRKQELKRITKDEALIRYRTPFFYGLITHEREFIAVDRYVGAHIQGVRGKARDLLEYIALLTIFSNTGLPEALVKLMLGLPETAKLSPVEIFGEGPARLISVRQGRLRLMHQVIAEEVLSDLLGGGSDVWAFELHHLAVDMIHDVVAVVDPNSQMVTDLFRQIFIERTGGEGDELDDRQNFSPLIERIDQIDKSLGHRVLTILKESCPGPNGSHFWNHLGRHQIYKMKRDFEKAEEYLRHAIDLAPDDYLHYHTYGLVEKFRVRETINSMRDKTANEVLEAITDFFNQAVEAFEKSRELSPENIYGHITHVQMILMVANGFKQLLNAQNIGQITSNERPVQEWITENIPVAHKLLYEADQLYGTLNQTDTYLTQCHADLQRLYGDMDQVITIWEVADARGNHSAASRRALANAYVARKDSRWSAMQHSELSRIKELMELNIHSSGRRDEDYRLWFEAYKLLPEFDIDEALAKLRLWISYFPSWRAYYYIYILHFFLWYTGREESTDEMENALEECQKRIVGKKSYSSLWLGYQPDWCPLVSASELGEWNRRENFWSETAQLMRVNGVIDEVIQSVQAGKIWIDGKTPVFFVPAAGGFSPNNDENKPVNFFLGFSPTGLRAWDVELGQIPDHDRVRPGNAAPRFEPAFIPAPPLTDKQKRERVRELRQERVMTFIDDLMQAKSQIEADLTLDELEQRVEAAFGIDGIAHAMGVHSLRSLLEGLPGYALTMEGKQTYVKLVNETPRTSRTQQTPKTGKVSYFYQGQGYGFIDDGSPTQYYFRRSHILPEFRERSIYKGTEVEFVPDVGMNGNIAIKIRFLDNQAAAQQDDGDLPEQVESKVRQILNDALITGQTVRYKDLCDQLFEAFPGKGRLTDRLGVEKISFFLRQLAGIRITGQFPELYVELQEKRTFGRLAGDRSAEEMPASQKAYLLEQVKAFLTSLVAGSERDGKPLEMTVVGDRLKEHFPGIPIYKKLGFEKLGALIKTLSELAIDHQSGRDYLVRKGKPTAKAPAAKTPAAKMPTAKAPARNNLPTTKAPAVKAPAAQVPVAKTPEAKTSAGQVPEATNMAEVGNVPGEPASPEELRSQVKAFIDSLVQAALEANKPLGITHLGDLLITRFPGDRVYQRLGFKKLSQLVASLDAYDVHTINDNQYLTFKGQMAPFPLPLPSVETAQPPVESQPPKNRPSEPPEVINELRQAICESLNQILLDCEQKGIKIELPAVSHRLKESFGNEHFKRSGYSKFSSLIRSFPEFTINITDDGHNYLERANPEDCAAITQLRAEVAACMLSQIESAGAEGKMIASSMMLYLVKAAFPDPRIQNCLGFSAPTDFLRSFPEIQVIQETGVDIILPAGAPRPGIPSGQSSSEL